MGVSVQRHVPAALYPGKKTPGTHCTGGWVGPSWVPAGLDTEVTGKILLPLPGIEPRSPGRPVCSQTLYWLSYLGSYLLILYFSNFDTTITDGKLSFVYLIVFICGLFNVISSSSDYIASDGKMNNE
jgi:hypothetical protein